MMSDERRAELKRQYHLRLWNNPEVLEFVLDYVRRIRSNDPLVDALLTHIDNLTKEEGGGQADEQAG